MTNDEIRRNDEIRMTKPATAQLRVFDIRASDFFRHSSFVIQRFAQVRFMVPMHAEERKGALHEAQSPNPNDELLNPKEHRNPKDETADRTPARRSTFELRISFVICNSTFVIQ